MVGGRLKIAGTIPLYSKGPLPPLGPEASAPPARRAGTIYGLDRRPRGLTRVGGNSLIYRVGTGCGREEMRGRARDWDRGGGGTKGKSRGPPPARFLRACGVEPYPYRGRDLFC